MFNWDFAQPLWLIGLLVIPLGWTGIYLRRKRRFNAYTFSSNQQLPSSALGSLRAASGGLSWLALAFVFTALARPQSSQMFQQPSQNLGIDLMMALDISTSMLARDLKPNRLEALKEVATDFVAQRAMDRLGLVIYAGEAYSPVPLTTDQSLLSQQISALHHEMLEGGTAIGMGLSTAVNRLVESTAKSKVIILLTDGENNGGMVDPVQAAELAASLGIKVYTIGLGTNGMASTPVMKDPRGNLIYQPRPVTIDEELLQRIASITGGQYFRATDNESLVQIYDSIDQLEKSEIEGFEFYRYTEHFSIFLYLALACIGLELLLNFVLLKTAF
ncbi:MAG: VWA domain-containing protein [Schleiferiaceae bacterium]|jgi:Ca-activated chloride channel homolog|nr:VWA domain-containing protein [Schleiferiaceae bacterium]MDP4759527.1 VWA domain-containing protein [Schleiferiaceae bacterium]MDP4767287.1 VWA domain-containing protein [Schleiferiaceae bacterium]MDP4959202.1 VWA domain-containing protein [Schleiferiaceae bacterium]